MGTSWRSDQEGLKSINGGNSGWGLDRGRAGGQGRGQWSGSRSGSGSVAGRISLSLSPDLDDGSMDSGNSFGQPCWFFGQGSDGGSMGD